MMRRKSHNFFYRPILFTLLLCSFFIGKSVSAQGYFHWNPADDTLPFSSEINPALVSKHTTQVAAGLQVFHYGFLQENSLALRENRLNLSFPYILPLELALGFDVRYFSANVYSELAASLLLSRYIFDRFSIGIKFALERRGFDSARFQGVDFSDPLLANSLSSNNLNLGFGAHWQNTRFTIGLGFDHVNRPGIGRIDASALVPMEVSGAVGYNIGLFTPTLLLHQDGDKLRFGLTIVAQETSLGTFRMGYEQQMPFRIEASFNLSKNNSMGYAIDVPGEGTRGASDGSHQLYYQHILGRAPELGQPEILFSTNMLNMLEKTVIRDLPNNLPIVELAASDEILPSYLSTDHSSDDLMVVVAGALSQQESSEGKDERYRRIREHVRTTYSRNSDVQVILRADKQTVQDAMQLKLFIQQHFPETQGHIKIAKIEEADAPDLRSFVPGRSTIQRQPLHLSAEKLTVRLPAPGNTRKTKAWKLTIENAAGNVVKTFSGKDKLPQEVEWDWRDESGNLIVPGNYTCNLRAITQYGNERIARQGPLAVELKKRKVMLKFGAEPQQQTARSLSTPETSGLDR